jgi:DNA-binding SARP family transcriptional activator
MGYLDVEGKKQFRLRMIATLRCSKLKQIYGSVLRDIKTIAKQTLPLWFVGWPSIVICINRPHGILISVVVATAVFMIVCQKGFSRYHYIPLTAFLAISTGLGITQFWEQGGIVGVTATTILFISSSWAGYKISPYFFKAQEISVLSRYEKFEQFIYLPLLGKSLRRLIRRKHEQNQRLFVWGNFVQLYHETGLPASDAFVHYCIGPWDNPALADYFDTVIGGLIRHKPVYFIKTYPNINMELLESITGLKYKLIKIAYSRYPVYKLENHNLKIQNPLALSQKEKLSLMEELTKNVSLVPIVDKSDIKCGRFLEGIKECRRALRANPYDAEIVKYLAELYDRSGQAHKVVDTLSTLIRLRPETNHVRLILASIALKKNRLDDGSLLIDQEVTCFGENLEIIFHRGLLAKAKGEIEFSAVLFKKFLESKPFRMDVWLELAQALEKCDKIGVAKDAYLDLWDRANKTDDSDWIRTQCALALSRLDECLRNKSSTLQYFFQKDASNEQLAYAYASALEIEGNSNQARSLFDNFTQTFRQTYLLAAVWFRLARLSESEKKEEMLRKCIELNPLHSGAERELQSLEASFAEA